MVVQNVLEEGRGRSAKSAFPVASAHFRSPSEQFLDRNARGRGTKIHASLGSTDLQIGWNDRC